MNRKRSIKMQRRRIPGRPLVLVLALGSAMFPDAAAETITLRIQGPTDQVFFPYPQPGVITHAAGMLVYQGATIGSGTVMHYLHGVSQTDLILAAVYELNLAGIGTFLIVVEGDEAGPRWPAYVLDRATAAVVVAGSATYGWGDGYFDIYLSY
jgi:hypothetical protein